MSQPLVEPHPPRGSSVLTKAIGTAAVGALTFFVTNGFTEDTIWQITLSVLLGSVTLVVQFIWDFDKRVQYMEQRQLRHYASMNELVQEGFSKISEATELFGLVEHSVLHTDQITQLVRYATRIKAEPQLFYDIGQSEINRVARFLKELGDGSMVFYDGEDRDLLLGLTRNVQKSLYAVSLGMVDSGGGGGSYSFWLSDLGRRYLYHQGEAVERGVKVRRVFILDRSDLLADPNFGRMCALQHDMNIEVRLLDPSKVAGTPQQMFDVILFDEAISYEVTSASALPEDRPTFLNTRLALHDEAVGQRVRHFSALWDSATPYVPPGGRKNDRDY
jgi:hypothetical protein